MKAPMIANTCRGTIARKYEESMARQQPYARLIEEFRLLDFGAELQNELDSNMLSGLSDWIRKKPGLAGHSDDQTAALLTSILGGWLFYLSMLERGAPVESLRDVMLNEWATRWASILDATP
jgi:hypothetical protein